MIVVDASAMVGALVGRDVDETLLEALAGEVAAPHILDGEVLSVLPGLVLARKLGEHPASAARSVHFGLVSDRHETAPWAERIWGQRHQYTSDDAAYIAVAEALEAPLHTCDAMLDSGGHHAVVHVHGQTH